MEPIDQASNARSEPASQVTPPQVSPSSPQPIPSMNRLIVLLCTLVVILLGITGYFAYQNYQLRTQVASVTLTPTPSQALPTPTPDPTANWNTYTNIKGNYTIKYPSDWTINTDEAEDERNATLKYIPIASSYLGGIELAIPCGLAAGIPWRESLKTGGFQHTL